MGNFTVHDNFCQADVNKLVLLRGFVNIVNNGFLGKG